MRKSFLGLVAVGWLAGSLAVPQPRFEPVDHPVGGPRWQALDDFWLASERERVGRIRSQHDRYGNTPEKLAVESAQKVDEPLLDSLVSRSDLKFEEFVDVRHPGDGLGLYREWASAGRCAPNMTITDSWGVIRWEAERSARGDVLQVPQECAWLIRPTIYRESGYYKTTKAPLTITFTEFDLSSSESLEVWDPLGDDDDAVARTLELRYSPKHQAKLEAAAAEKAAADAEKNNEELREAAWPPNVPTPPPPPPEVSHAISHRDTRFN